jgi:hypothetical protein
MNLMPHLFELQLTNTSTEATTFSVLINGDELSDVERLAIQP